MKRREEDLIELMFGDFHFINSSSLFAFNFGVFDFAGWEVFVF